MKFISLIKNADKFIIFLNTQKLILLFVIKKSY